MINKKDTEEFRSDEVHEILTAIPSWIIRWGNLLVLVIIFSFFFLAWFIEYPDVIKGDMTLTTKNPPVRIYSKISGEIENITSQDNTKIINGQIIASIKSTLNRENKNFLVEQLFSINQSLQFNKQIEIDHSFFSRDFGEIQNEISDLLNVIKEYQDIFKNEDINFQIQNTNNLLAQQKKNLALTNIQLNNKRKIAQNADFKYKSDIQLYNQGVISKIDFLDRENIYELILDELNSIEKSKINVSTRILELEKTLYDLKSSHYKSIRKIQLNIENQLSKITGKLNNWKKTYFITSPINGRLSFIKTLSDHQHIDSDQALFAVIPNDQNYYANLKIAKNGFGKIKKGLRVLLELDNYPAYEFGKLEGKIESFSLLPDTDFYQIKVQLPKKLRTTYKFKVKYKPEMTGSAEIITENLKIAERIFNQFKQLFNK